MRSRSLSRSFRPTWPILPTWRALAFVLAAAPAVLGLSGCNTYKYVDVHVTFDAATFSSDSALAITVCKVTVSGADSTSFPLPEGKCPNRVKNQDPLDPGVFEYSTFADSGTLTFHLEAFVGTGQRPECKAGDGSVSIPVTSATTLTGDLKVARATPAATCTNVTPPAGST
jgi:hypothetical protein